MGLDDLTTCDWRKARYANGIATELKPRGLWVRLPPVLLPAAGNAFGRAVGRRAACNAAALAGNVGSIPTRGTRRKCGFRNAEFRHRDLSSFRIPNSAFRITELVM